LWLALGFCLPSRPSRTVWRIRSWLLRKTGRAVDTQEIAVAPARIGIVHVNVFGFIPCFAPVSACLLTDTNVMWFSMETAVSLSHCRHDVSSSVSLVNSLPSFSIHNPIVDVDKPAPASPDMPPPAPTCPHPSHRLLSRPSGPTIATSSRTRIKSLTTSDCNSSASARPPYGMPVRLCAQMFPTCRTVGGNYQRG